jgi:RNA-directed DNA polymerase
VIDEKSNQKDRPKKRSEMSGEERVRDFQRKLYQKAKEEKTFRFYILYDKIKLQHVLGEAFRRCRAKGGSPGIDGISFEEIEERIGTDEFLEKIRNELETETYRPNAVKRVYIPKANGKMRPLGIPVIKDRVIQMACKMIIEPIFEADFEDCSYGFRPKRSGHDAMRTIREELEQGNVEIYDADLSAYFDTIPHKELMQLIGQRIADVRVLHLIKMWLKAPISEDGKMSGGKKNKRGTPQGGVISPLLANIYLNLLDKAVKRVGGVFRKAGVTIVRYADDFVLMGEKITGEVLQYLYGMLERMKLSVNREKTKLLNAMEEEFSFLGFVVRYDQDLHGRNRRYWNMKPGRKAEQKLRDRLKEYLNTHRNCPPEVIARDINSIMKGWINYFTIAGVSYPQQSKRKLRWYVMDKLQRFYYRKSQRKSRLYRKGAYEVLRARYGMIDPRAYAPPMATVKAI